MFHLRKVSLHLVKRATESVEFYPSRWWHIGKKFEYDDGGYAELLSDLDEIN